MRFQPLSLVAALIMFIAVAALLLLRFPTGPAPDRHRLVYFETALPLPASWTGDLDGMLKRRLVRILVPYNKMYYFHDGARERGIVHDAGMELGKWLNRKYGQKNLPIRVVFIPTSREFLLEDLVDGVGDIAAGNLTITPERQKVVDFTDPTPQPVDEIIVTGPSAPSLSSLQDLAKVPIYVRKTSSYYEHLQALDEELSLGLKIRLADDVLEDEGILEMVNAGMLPLAVVDNHKAQFWAEIFPNLVLREELVINQGGRIAWAVRKQSPKLLAELNLFRKTQDRKVGLSNMLLKRYLETTRYVDNALEDQALSKFDALKTYFEKYAQMYGLDALLLMAQGYQESHLRQSVRSPSGAVGIMQVLPRTAAKPPIEIHDVAKSPEQNIHAGVKYMRHLIDTYVDDPKIDPQNQYLLALAAYNAGPRNLRKMRQRAEKMGLNPNIWFNHVEQGAAKVIGRETVQYVSNIYKYYLAYRLVEEERLIRTERASQWKQQRL